MIQLTNFTPEDSSSFMGVEPFSDGSLPRIYYFSDEEIESFFDLTEFAREEDDFVYVVHHKEGLILGWTAEGIPSEISWEEGIMSERVEYLLESLDPHTLPLWAMSVAKLQK